MQTKLIEEAMLQNHISLERMAQELGISTRLMEKKLVGRSEFNLIQAVLLSELLCLSNPREVFF